MFNKYPHYFAIPDNFLGQMNLEGLSVSSLKAEPPKINVSCIAEGGVEGGGCDGRRRTGNSLEPSEHISQEEAESVSLFQLTRVQHNKIRGPSNKR